MPPQMKRRRMKSLPEELRLALVAARRERGWSQAELGKRVGIAQMHISGIETGKIVPRYDTLLELVRVLDHDLLMVPRSLVPAVRALLRPAEGAGEESLYASETGEDGGDEA